jgi:hypothetical protein
VTRSRWQPGVRVRDRQTLRLGTIAYVFANVAVVDWDDGVQTQMPRSRLEIVG